MLQHRTLIGLGAVALCAALWAGPSGAASVTLMWTAPGDDGLVGRAYRYDLRYSTGPMTAQSFDQATSVANMPFPSNPGVTQSFTVDGLTAGVVYYFALRTVDSAGNWSGISNVLAVTPAEIAADLSHAGLSFSSPMPNPARDAARFSFSLPVPGEVRIQVFDFAGRLVRTLSHGPRDAGSAEIAWDLRDERGGRLPVGVYLVRARLGTARFLRRLVVVH